MAPLAAHLPQVQVYPPPRLEELAPRLCQQEVLAPVVPRHRVRSGCGNRRPAVGRVHGPVMLGESMLLVEETQTAQLEPVR